MRNAATDSPVVETLANDWLEHCRAEGKLASTMHNYRYAIDGILLPWCQEKGIVEAAALDQAAVTELNLSLLSRTRQGKPISKYTVQAYLRPICHFIDWARSEGYVINGRPALPRTGKPKPKDVLTREEIQRMEDTCHSERDKLIIRLLGDTGMRIGELCRLRPQDLIERNRHWFLYVHGKGDNDRFVPVPRIHSRLRRWIDRGRPQPCAEAIFVALRGQGFYPALGYSGAWSVVTNAAIGAGIGKKAHPHLLRHSFITHLRRKGHNDAQISMIVGNFRKLDVYTWLDSSDVYSLMATLD